MSDSDDVVLNHDSSPPHKQTVVSDSDDVLLNYESSTQSSNKSCVTAKQTKGIDSAQQTRDIICDSNNMSVLVS